jgi:hypothetical protein
MRKAKREKLVNEVRKNLVNAATESGSDKFSTDIFTQGVDFALEAMNESLKKKKCVDSVYKRVKNALRPRKNSIRVWKIVGEKNEKVF